MKTFLIKISTLLVVLAASFYSFSQSNFSAKLLFLDANLFDDINKNLYTSRITNDGFLTFEPGLNLATEFFGSETTSFKFSQTLFFDQTKSTAGSTQIMLRFKVFSERKNSFNIGLGPVMFFRSTWADFPGYTQDESFKQTGNIQYSFFWLSAELEYNRIINKKYDFSISLNHLHKYSVTLMVGFKYWFSRKSSHCNTCPSYR